MNQHTSIGDLRPTLNARGFAVTHSGSLDAFREVCGTLGSITQEKNVCIKPNGAQYPDRPDAVPMHTDHPHVPIVAWHCLQNDEKSGELLLLDVRPLVTALSENARSLLGKAMLQVIGQDQEQPILKPDPFHIYWVPRFIGNARPRMNAETIEAIRVLGTSVDDCYLNGGTAFVHLKPGEEVFVNNQFVLHGRMSIPATSPRHHVRAYIK